MGRSGQQPKKLCFVTIGATASFDSLIQACFEPDFLNALCKFGYTDLLIQYGKDRQALFDRLKDGLSDDVGQWIRVAGFDFNVEGLGQEMRLAKGPDGVDGVVISHAGSGSILDALRIDVPLIVVPNPDLLDNHQVELAEVLEAQGYVVHGKLNNLADAIGKSEELRKRHKEWPPVNSGKHRRTRGLAGVMDEEMGFVE